jgi:hypothetical protein
LNKNAAVAKPASRPGDDDRYELQPSSEIARITLTTLLGKEDQLLALNRKALSRSSKQEQVSQQFNTSSGTWRLLRRGTRFWNRDPWWYGLWSIASTTGGRMRFRTLTHLIEILFAAGEATIRRQPLQGSSK